ncbi:MAG: hypothetical protein ACFFCI_02490 [Promethearchaeota archaeon]
MVYVEILIIRAKFDLATEYTNWIGEGLKEYLESKGYTVMDLSDDAASPENVEYWLDINNERISKAVIALDHGGNNAFYGEKNNQITEIINLSNVARLTERLHVYTLACSTNAPNGLGQNAISRGCYSWLGYTEPVYAANSQSFKDCIWSYIEAMAEGKTLEQCVTDLRDAYESRDSESFIYKYNLDRLLLRSKDQSSCMKINTHNREKICFRCICLKVYFDYPSAGWKDNYCVIVEIENNEEFDIVYDLECKERETNSVIIDIENGTIPGSSTETLTSTSICQDWTWISNTPCATLSDEVNKEFNYDITFIIKTPVNHSYPTIYLKKNVVVSDQKLSYRSESNNFCLGAITHYSLAAILGSIPFCWPCAIAASANLAIAIVMNATAINLNNQANDPIEFDKNYSEIHDFSPLIRKFKVEGLIPIHVKRFGDRYNKIGAQFKSLDITYNRFYSSLKVGDKNSAGIQKERAINLAELMEEDLIKMKNHLLKIKKFDEDLKKMKIKEDDIEKALKEYKEKGLSEEYKERLTKQGLSKQMIERISETSGRLRKENLRREIYPSYQNLYHHILSEFLTKKEKINDMKRIEGLSEEKLMRRLQKKGLVERRDEFKSGRNQERKRKFS